jgi:N-acetylglucosamine-6-sulfatase
MLAVERGIAEILGTLESTGRLDSTYLIFTSDNGYHLGEHRLYKGKTTHYEESMRVPLTIQGPGIEAGTRVGHLAINNDLAPTIAHLGGARAPAVDGTSLVPVLRPETRPPVSEWRQRFLNANWQHNTYMRWSPTQAVRTRFALYSRTADGPQEYYDLAEDPHQVDSRHASLSPTEVRRHDRLLDALMACAGQKSCRRAEGFAVP